MSKQYTLFITFSINFSSANDHPEGVIKLQVDGLVMGNGNIGVKEGSFGMKRDQECAVLVGSFVESPPIKGFEILKNVHLF